MAGTIRTTALFMLAVLIGGSGLLWAGAGDPQIKTNHLWNPGELSCSTFARLWATQAAQYTRDTGRACTSDQDKAIAAWYWRNRNYFHCSTLNEDIYGTGFASGDYNREYWRGLFGNGFSLCFETHAQLCGEIEFLLGHGKGRAMGVQGHTSMEVWLDGINDWAVLDHDISTIVFDAANTSLLSIQDCSVNLAVLDNAGAPAHNQGWFIAGLYYNSPTDNDAYGTYAAISNRKENFGYSSAPPVVNLRNGEKLRRYVGYGLGGSDWVFWGQNLNYSGIWGPGRDRQWCEWPADMYQTTADTPTSRIARPGNAVFTYTPDFSTTAYKEGVVSENTGQVTFEFYSPYVIAGKPTTSSATALYDSGATMGLVITSANTGTTAQVSTDNGGTWSSTVSLNGTARDLTDLVKGHYGYMLRFNAGASTLAGKNITITTIGQANQYVMPHLVDGSNTITYEASGKAVFAAGPNRDQCAPYITSGAWNAGSDIIMNIPSPNGGKILEVYGYMWVASGSPPNTTCAYDIDCNTGSGWAPMVDNWHMMNRGYDPGDSQSTSMVFGNADISSANAAAVQVRFSNTESRTMLYGGVQIVYETANDSQVKVTFNYTDNTGNHTAEHTYTAGQTTADTSWTFSTGTSTVTKWIEFESIGGGTPFVDADGDGMDDNWETTHFSGLSHNGAADSDSDGAIDLHEYLAGTDPMNGSSSPDEGDRPGGSGTPHSITLDDTAILIDGEIDGETPDTDLFGGSYLRIEGHSNVAYHNRSFIKFDLSSITDCSTVTSATLKMAYRTGSFTDATPPYDILVGAASADIVAATPHTWNGMNTITSLAGDNTSFGAAGTDNVLENLTATSAVRHWLENSNPNNGFIIKFADDTARHMKRGWYSNDQGGVNHPELLINYESGGGTVPNNAPVIASASGTPTGLNVAYTVAATDADSDAMTYAWDFDLSDDADFGDAATQSPGHLYAVDGTFLAAVRVSDAYGGYDYAVVQVIVNANDADGDHMDDTWEIDNLGGTGVSDGTTDYDGDGASDLLEYLAGTDPDNNTDFNAATDTDIDGMADIWEFANFGDLNEDGTGDADSDGLDDNEEDDYATDPNDADSDGDGDSDGYEISHGTDPNDPLDFTNTVSSGSSSGGCLPGAAAGLLSYLFALLGLYAIGRRRA